MVIVSTTTSSWMLKLVIAKKNRIHRHTCRRMDALKLLDEDSWEEVLNRVEDPKDLRNCIEVCLLFQKILRTKKNAFMSSLILPHLLPYLRDAGVPEKNKLEVRKSLLKYRLVCKSWCHSLDKLHEDVHELPYDPAFGFTSGKQTEEFLQTFATHNGNPFRGRLVSLLLFDPLLLADIQMEAPNADEDEANFHVRKLRHLLESFGNKMGAVNLLGVNQSELIYWKNFITILTHLPNLRTLRIFNIGVELEGPTGMAELPTYIDPKTLPALPLLENLIVQAISNVKVLSLILEKYAPKLKSLVVSDPSVFPEQGLQLCSLNLLLFESLDASTSLLGLRQVQAPRLGGLVFKVATNRNNVEVWPIDELFGNIQHLPIQVLEIAVTGENVFVGETENISAEHRARHESIAGVLLRFQNGNVSVSLNFLLWCPKLKSIDMYRREQGTTAGHPYGVTELLDVNELVKQVGHDLYQSNIWEMLPNLESFKLHQFDGGIEVKLDVYVRAEYEKRKFEEGWEDVEEDVSDTE